MNIVYYVLFLGGFRQLTDKYKLYYSISWIYLSILTYEHFIVSYSASPLQLPIIFGHKNIQTTITIPIVNVEAFFGYMMFIEN
jgi:hypothetical protein